MTRQINRSSRFALAAALATVSGLAAGAPAIADATEDRANALEACTAAVAEQAGVTADALSTSRVQFRTRGGVIKVYFRASAGEQEALSVYCEYNRRSGEIAELTVG